MKFWAHYAYEAVVIFSWDPPLTEPLFPVLYYDVYQLAAGQAEPVKLVSVNGTVHAVTMEGLSIGTLDLFFVWATTADGTSPPSNPANPISKLDINQTPPWPCEPVRISEDLFYPDCIR